MKFGIQKRQWLLLFLALSIPLLLNAVGIWQNVGTNVILQLLRGTYSPYPYKSFGVIYNPLPEIFLKLLLFAAALGFLAWLIVFISNKAFFNKQPLITKVCETLLMACLVGLIFETITGVAMPLVWLPKFHDYILGLPGSSFMVEWSHWLVLPTTVIILFGDVLFFEYK